MAVMNTALRQPRQKAEALKLMEAGFDYVCYIGDAKLSEREVVAESFTICPKARSKLHDLGVWNPFDAKYGFGVHVAFLDRFFYAAFAHHVYNG